MRQVSALVTLSNGSVDGVPAAAMTSVQTQSEISAVLAELNKDRCVGLAAALLERQQGMQKISQERLCVGFLSELAEAALRPDSLRLCSAGRR